jgi:hypothetical protein
MSDNSKKGDLIPNWKRTKLLTQIQRKKILTFYALHSSRDQDCIKAIVELCKMEGDYGDGNNNKQSITINVSKDDLKI